MDEWNNCTNLRGGAADWKGTYLDTPNTCTVIQEWASFANFLDVMHIPYIQTVIIVYTTKLKQDSILLLNGRKIIKSVSSEVIYWTSWVIWNNV